MKKYTANYAYTNPNFVIQNLVSNMVESEFVSILYVLKNILQRGFPTTLSENLQSKLGKIHKLDNFSDRLLFATNNTPVWHNTIRGDNERNYFPAKEFLEQIIPNEFGDYSFIQSLLIPEIEINEIVGELNTNFINQQVDFYLPQAKLVIEIDGQQHKYDDRTRISDNERDGYLLSKGITTVRITTIELRNGQYKNKIDVILAHIGRHEKILQYYSAACSKIEFGNIDEIEIRTKLLPTAIIRFQILLIELILCGYMKLDEDWNFNILSHEKLPEFVELAIEDLFIWIDNLWQLRFKKEFRRPNYIINVTNDSTQFEVKTGALNIDFSLFKRYTDENILQPDIVYVRTDYFDIVKDRNYFKVSTSEPINYEITNDDKATLEFFLLNIFDKPSFRDGQFPIIANALNRKDTIGLLPTGGGKSICYQLPCLLQPSINFVVCPIKSLMYDQKENLERLYLTNTNYIVGDQSPNEKEYILNEFSNGRYLFIWISPERFQIPVFRRRIEEINSYFSIAYAVVDEVHCLSEWGHDFRTSYLNLAKTIDKLSVKDENEEGNIKFIGLTATASVNVLKDIKIEFSRQRQRLEDDNIKSLLDYSRKELQFQVINDNGKKHDSLTSLLSILKDTEGLIEDNKKAGLIFTPNVNGPYGCFHLSNSLNTIYPKKAAWYSGDIPKRDIFDERTGRKIGTAPVMELKEFNEYKVNIQKDFKFDKYPLMVATKAFGMGIDKQNIYYTFHYGLPSSIESLYQEAGRAGRWDKRHYKDDVAKCYVLHSHETCDNDTLEELFDKDTNFSRIKSISKEVGFQGRDVFKQIFLFVQGQKDIEEDYEIIIGIVDNYFRPNSKVKIFWNDVYKTLSINSDTLQKAIYRLSLLGIVHDWTTNFQDHYDVEFGLLNDATVLKSLSEYITKYEPNTDVSTEVLKSNKGSVLGNAIWYLLNWTFENIAYNRKQSLKTLSDWCTEFVDSESFKERLDSYFKFTETTFILQHIAENPTEYLKWFEVLTTNDQFPNVSEFQKLKDSISRFLESYRNNIGINFISGFVRLALDDFEDEDGKKRFDNSLSTIKKNFQVAEIDDFLSRLKIIGSHLSEIQKVELSNSIKIYWPEMLPVLAKYYDLAYLLNDIYQEKIQVLRKLNTELYEQLRKI